MSGIVHKFCDPPPWCSKPVWPPWKTKGDILKDVLGCVSPKVSQAQVDPLSSMELRSTLAYVALLGLSSYNKWERRLSRCKRDPYNYIPSLLKLENIFGNELKGQWLFTGNRIKDSVSWARLIESFRQLNQLRSKSNKDSFMIQTLLLHSWLWKGELGQILPLLENESVNFNRFYTLNSEEFKYFHFSETFFKLKNFSLHQGYYR